MVSLAAVPGRVVMHPREMRMERGAGSSCMMHPWVRDDCGHELYSPLLLQHIPNPRAGWLDSRTEALCVVYRAAHVASAGGGVCW